MLLNMDTGAAKALTQTHKATLHFPSSNQPEKVKPCPAHPDVRGYLDVTPHDLT